MDTIDVQSPTTIRKPLSPLLHLLSVVSIETGIPIEDIKGRSQVEDIVRARRLYFIRAAITTDYPMEQICRRVDRQTSAVIQMVKKYCNRRGIPYPKRHKSGRRIKP